MKIVTGLLKVIERIDELIVEMPNLIPDEWCDLMVDWFHANSNLQQDGGVVNGNDEQAVLLDFKIATQSIVPFKTPMFDLMTKIWTMAYDKLAEQIPGVPIDNVHFRDYSIRVYEKNKGIFKRHVDHNSGGNVTRLFALILYLNDVEEGGETEFPTLNKKVKPEKGKVLLFPCMFLYPHQGNISISNDKYIATAFANYELPRNFQ